MKKIKMKSENRKKKKKKKEDYFDGNDHRSNAVSFSIRAICKHL